MLGKLKNNRGFTLIELLMVFVVMGIMAQMGLTFVLDLKSRSSDIMAISDGRNFVTVVRNNFVYRDDVDYTHNPGDGSNLGTVDTSGNPRPEGPVFTMSPGVEVTINGDSDPDDDANIVVATFYHSAGTADAGSGSGKREFYYVIDQLGDDILATY
jgi:prepilin-type N-terminal cleavage/methylation domain-containing protein